MAKVLYDLAAVVSKRMVNGEEKPRWKNIGVEMEGQNGGESYLLIDPTVNLAAFPREEGRDSIIIRKFPHKDRNGNNGNNRNGNNDSGGNFYGNGKNNSNFDPSAGDDIVPF